ncbi:hypothetical protein SIN8267_00224 [Sinobacterium norvegicum]|uniref:Type VI secretion system baseplate subunit TssF n=1 Tax=Sinobacterium norvegicum TaxID=1641715 RepID=A0ABN8EDT4_9GAMM|nr:type VI secretion system baseplate subunit TssF [Sinobacterium norvegicum]CAH0990139.1 hypothetical protein SIN8267_00224 [Sinobacterium norvegicum]
MSDKLLPFYERELAFIQQTAGDFSKRHPTVASSLTLDSDTVDDPLVAKMLSGVAYLNARVQQQLSDDFPQVADALMGSLYPHYQRPIPPSAIIQHQPPQDLQEIQTVPAGSEVETHEFDGNSCRFRTGYNSTIAPYKVSHASLQSRPFHAPASDQIYGASSVLSISLETLNSDCNLYEAMDNQLRFFLKGQSQQSHQLYDLILTKAVKVVIAHSNTDDEPIILEAEILQQAGLDIADNILPYPDNVFSGYRLLTEYFCFPDRFLFFEMNGIADKLTKNYRNTINLYIYLTESDIELEHQFSDQNLALNCTPVINLFEQRAEPISLKHQSFNYPLSADNRQRSHLEIFSIDSVHASNHLGDSTQYLPFYSAKHFQSEQRTYWHANRVDVFEGQHGNEEATDIELNFVDLSFNPHHSNDQLVSSTITCFNRNTVKKLPNSSGQPHFKFVDIDAAAESIQCITTFTPTYRPARQERGYWRLFSHLNLNHLSLNDKTGEALREILSLYNFSDSASTRNIIKSIVSLYTRPYTAPITIDGTTAMCRGTEVTLTLNKQMLQGTSILIFTSVLERFLALYCSINSFSKLVVKFSDTNKEFKQWPPRAGEKALL